jgi:phosphoribosylformylglycinamidine cyclo-ligase
VVEGVAAGCIEALCALIGGETAEMPGFYPPDEYDLAGFCTGAADASRLFKPSAVRPGDALIALPSSGVHSNGFSLIREIFHLDGGALEAENALSDYASVLGRPLGEELLLPTRIYVKPLLDLSRELPVHSAAHITGGGFFENIPRSLPEGLGVRVKMPPSAIPPIFRLIAEKGAVPARDMFNTFNMGVGMTALVDKADQERAIAFLRAAGVAAFLLGEAVPGGGVVFEGGYERLLE